MRDISYKLRGIFLYQPGEQLDSQILNRCRIESRGDEQNSIWGRGDEQNRIKCGRKIRIKQNRTEGRGEERNKIEQRILEKNQNGKKEGVEHENKGRG